eukprot:11074793-Alexandrium_andersonii.AAC.1
MSASLVGSEMCIRDSFPPLSPLWCTQGCSACYASAAPSAEQSQGSHTVSYTHLTLPTICSV